MVKSYCVKQKKQTECVEPSGYKQAKNGRLMFFCTCAECGIKKTKFVNQKQLVGVRSLVHFSFQPSHIVELEKFTREHALDQFQNVSIPNN